MLYTKFQEQGERQIGRSAELPKLNYFSQKSLKYKWFSESHNIH